MKRLTLSLLLCLNLQSAAAFDWGMNARGEDNPFVEAMLRMMESFGLVDDDSASVTTPYSPGNWQDFSPTPWSGTSPMPPMSGMSPMGGMMPGMSPMGGMMPGMSPGGMPGMQNWQQQIPWQQYRNMQQPSRKLARRLNGAWETNNGGLLLIQGDKARFYLTRDQHQDLQLAITEHQVTLKPATGGEGKRYRYQVKNNRMVLRDPQGSWMLLRRIRKQVK